MKLDNWIISKSANSIALALLSPMLLGFLLLFIVGTNNHNSVIGTLGIVVFLELAFYIIYTNSLASIVIQHSKGVDLSMEPIKSASLVSGTVLTGLCLSLVYINQYTALIVAAFMVSEYVRYYRIARVLMAVEKQPLNFWNYLSHIWLLANPIVGIWPLNQRVKNFVINQETEASSEQKKG